MTSLVSILIPAFNTQEWIADTIRLAVSQTRPRAIYLGLATAGAQLCLLGRDGGTLDELAKTTRGVTDGVFAYPVDLTSDASVLEATDRLLREVGRVDTC